jgi:hypothetical protein
MAMTIGVNKRPQGFDFASLVPGMGPHFQRLQGTGQVDQGMAQTIGGMRTGIDALASGMPLYDSASFNSAEVGRPSSQPIGLWYGYAGNNQEDNAAQNVWNLTNNANLDRNAYLYGRPDASRVEDGLSRTDYFDAKGKHKYTDVLNDPGTVGAFTPGDLGLIASGLGAMAGVYGIGNLLSSGIANAATSGAGFVGEGAASGIPGWDAALAGATPGELGAVGTGAGFIGEGAASGIPGWDAAIGGATAGEVGAGGGLSGLLGGLGGAKSWLPVAATVLGGLAGSKGQQQSQTQTRELPPYLQGPVTGKNGLLSSADRLMQHQLYGTPMGLLK